MGRRQMDVLRTCQPSTQVHTAALSLDPQWMAVQVDTGEEPCATSIQRPTQPLITEMIENASMTTRWFGWLPQEIARLVMKFAWEHGRVCEAGHLYPIQNETEVKKTAAMAGFTCTHYYRETWSVSGWDGPLLRLNSGLCVYNGNPIWKPSCSAKPACGYGHRLCPCRT